jgi:hypothetical protein
MKKNYREEGSLPIIIRLMQRTVSIDDGEYRFELVFFPPLTSLYVRAIEKREEMRDRDKKRERNSVRCK